MEHFSTLLHQSPILPLFMAVAAGHVIGKLRVGSFALGGLAGTLLAAIGIGLLGVQTDDSIKSIAFALFIYSLGYVSGPQFFSSLGRETWGQVHMTLFSALVLFCTIWLLATLFGLDKGTAAGLLAGATTESAAIGTASEALRNLGLEAETVQRMEANIAVTYAMTYLFGMMLVVFFSSRLAPKLLRIQDFSGAARELEKQLGAESGMEAGQFPFMREIIARMIRVQADGGAGLALTQFEKRYGHEVTFQRITREGRELERNGALVLQAGDLVVLVGMPEAVVEAGRMLGVEALPGTLEETLVGEMRDVVITRRAHSKKTLAELRQQIALEKRRGAYVVALTRMERNMPLLPGTVLHLGDVVRIIGVPASVDYLARELGQALAPGAGVDYFYLATGIIAGILIGAVPLPVLGTNVEMGVGGGCLLSGLLFGWLRAKFPTFGNLPSATAAHMRDFGLSVFIASIGLAAGPQAWSVIQEHGFTLPLLAIVIVLVSQTTSLLYAKYVLKMHPVLITGALAGLLTCTPALNAAVKEAGSELPVLGYTVPYAIANVLLTLMGPVIVLVV